MRRVPSAVVVALALVGAPAPAAVAAPTPTLGSGLARLLQPAPRRAGLQLTMAPLAIRDGAGRVLVDVFATRGAPSPRAAAVAAGLKPVAAAPGAIAGYVALDRVEALAAAPGVATVALAVRPVTAAGAVTSQGVHAQRADRLPPGIDGRGITVAALSDSFDTAATNADGEPLAIHAADDVATGDLPAGGSPCCATSRRASARTRVARCCRSSTTSRPARASASPPPGRGRSPSPPRSVRSPTRRAAAGRTSSSTTSRTSTSRSSARASSATRSTTSRRRASTTSRPRGTSPSRRPTRRRCVSRRRTPPGRTST